MKNLYKNIDNVNAIFITNPNNLSTYKKLCQYEK